MFQDRLHPCLVAISRARQKQWRRHLRVLVRRAYGLPWGRLADRPWRESRSAAEGAGAIEWDAKEDDARIVVLPDAGQVEPADAAHVHVVPDKIAGTVSVTVAPVTVDGPALEATIVYVTDVPGTSPAAPSVLVIDRSAVGFNVSVSVAALFAAVGSVTPAATAAVAVFASVPVGVEAMVAVRVKVAVPLGSRSTVVLMLPEPDAGHVEPPEAVHVQVAPERLAGSVSVMVVATAADGPAFEATMV